MVYFALTGLIGVCTAAPAPPAFQPAALPKLELGADNCIDMFGMGISVSVRTVFFFFFGKKGICMCNAGLNELVRARCHPHKTI